MYCFRHTFFYTQTYYFFLSKTMKKNILIYGLGAFGFANLRHLDKNTSETNQWFLVGYDVVPEVMQSLQDTGRHQFRYTDLTYNFSSKVQFITDVESLLPEVDVLVLAVPSQFLLDVIQQIYPKLKPTCILVNVSKALSPHWKLFSQEFQILWVDVHNQYAMLAWGMIAQHFFEGFPLGCTIATQNQKVQQTLQNVFASDKLFVQFSNDIVGTECAGAFKNIGSILMGRFEWKNYPYGTITYYITRFSEEIEKLAYIYFNANKQTFTISSQCRGNDYFMSCTSNTRNKQFGKLLGQGNTFDQAQKTMLEQKKTIEGTKTLAVLQNILSNYKAEEFPLLSQCVNFLTNEFKLVN